MLQGKINIFLKESPFFCPGILYNKTASIGFFVTDGEHYQLFQNNIIGQGRNEEECLNNYYHIMIRKLTELINLFELWEQNSLTISEIILNPSEFCDLYKTKHYPKPGIYWTVDKLSEVIKCSKM